MTEVFMITGPAGSGKTTLGRALSDRLGGVTLDLDDVATDLVRSFRSSNPDVTEAEALTLLREDRYRLLASHARSVLAHSSTPALVLIAPFTAETSSPARWRQWLSDLDITGGGAHLVWLQIDPVERLRRLRARGETRDAAVVAADEATETPLPMVDALVIDAGESLVTQVDRVLQRFGNG